MSEPNISQESVTDLSGHLRARFRSRNRAGTGSRAHPQAKIQTKARSLLWAFVFSGVYTVFAVRLYGFVFYRIFQGLYFRYRPL